MPPFIGREVRVSARYPIVASHVLAGAFDYDPLADITWIIAVADYFSGVVVRADAPWRAWQDFITHAEANPRKVSYATTGNRIVPPTIEP